MKILVVEDESKLAQLLGVSLRERKFDPTMVTTLLSAQEALVRQKFDVIVLDLSLPDSEPHDTLAQIKDLKVMNGGGRVLVMTGYDSLELRAHAKTAGADMFISKACPDIFEEISQAVKKRHRWAPCFLVERVDRLERESILVLASVR